MNTTSSVYDDPIYNQHIIYYFAVHAALSFLALVVYFKPRPLKRKNRYIQTEPLITTTIRTQTELADETIDTAVLRNL